MRNFILGTDWGEDCDDVVAVRILSRYHKAKKINLCAIGINTCVDVSAASLYGFLKTEGVDIPVGVDKNCPHKIQTFRYQPRLAASYAPDKTNDDAEDSVRLYRRILAQATEPVEIMEIGFLQVIAGALMSEPDDISDKSGMELFKEKVSRVWIMGGKWDEQGGKEYNFSCYPFACRGAADFVNNCPVPITFLGWEIGANLITGDKLGEGDVLLDVLRDHGSGSGRESWDPMLVLLAVIGNEEAAGYKTVIGKAKVDGETGKNYFEEDENGTHKYVIKAQSDSYYSDLINGIIA